MSTLILNHDDLIDKGKEPTKDNIRYNIREYDVILFRAGRTTIVLKSLTKDWD